MENILFNEVIKQEIEKAIEEYTKICLTEPEPIIQANTKVTVDLTSTSNEINESKLNVTSFDKENFSDLLQSSFLDRNKKKPLFKKDSNKRFQTLEFVSPKNRKSLKSLTLNETTIIFDSPKEMDYTMADLTMNETNKVKYVISETPTKSNNDSNNVNEINNFLSKSSNRMELVDSKIYLDSSKHEIEPIINEDTNNKTSLSEREEEEDEKTDQIDQSKKGTFNSIVSSITNKIEASFTNNITEINQLPPAAIDILGTSILRDSLSATNYGATNKSVTTIPNSDETKKDLKDKETQLLTDSQISIIDVISKQNNSFSINNGSLLTNSKSIKNKIYFVCSLLRPPEKVSKKNFKFL